MKAKVDKEALGEDTSELDRDARNFAAHAAMTQAVRLPDIRSALTARFPLSAPPPAADLRSRLGCARPGRWQGGGVAPPASL